MPSKSKVAANWLIQEAIPAIFTYGMFIAALYALNRRPFLQAALFSISIAIVMCVAMYAGLYVEWRQQDRPSLGIKGYLILIVGVPMASLICGLGLYGSGVGAIDLFVWSLATDEWKPLAVVLITLYTLAAGWLLFGFRYSARALYGLTEVAAGVAVSAHRVITPSIIRLDDLSLHLAILTAGIYLVVRGFDNIHQGLTKDPIDPVATYLLEKLRRKVTVAEDAHP